MGTPRPPAPDHAGEPCWRARSESRSDSPLDHFEAVTDLDVLALSTPLGVFRSTAADGIVWVNRRFLEIVGLAQDQVLGSDWLRAVHPLDRRRVDEAAPRALRRARASWCSQFRIVRAGRACAPRARPRAPRRRRARRAAGVRRRDRGRDRPGRELQAGDCRRRRRPVPLARGRVRRSGSSTRTSSGRVVYVNDRVARDLRHRSAEDILGTDDLRVAHPDDRDAIFESMSAAALAGEEWFGEMRVLRPDGEIRHTRTSLAAIRDVEGTITGYVGTLEDVTDEADGPEAGRARAAGRVAAEALVAETSRTLVTASVDDVDDRVVAVLERLARFVGADSAVLAAR